MDIDKITKAGRYFLALPMIVFGIQHFLYAEFVAQLVPTWIPAPLFWTYFAGLALLAAGIGITTNVRGKLAATLLGLMISTWVIVLHIPRVFQFSGDSEFINVFDALFILSGAYLLSASLPGKTSLEKISVTGAKAAPVLIALSVFVFGIEHFIHGKLVFIVGAAYYNVPGATFWVYLTGVIFIVASLGIVLGRKVSLIATSLGLYILFIAIVFYGPNLFINIYDGHSWATLLKGIAMSGSALNLSRAAIGQQVLISRSVRLS